MKTLNDTLRDEFQKILKSSEIKKEIEIKKLEKEILDKAFEVLLKNKSNPDRIDLARLEFENFLINYLKSKK
jgi:hypothetical protein